MTGPAPAAPPGDLCGLLGVDRHRLAEVIARLSAARLTVATAESLTAGLVAAVLTEIPGSSAVVRGGIVCYATDLKHSLLGVDADLLRRRGPVDPAVAAQLASGARSRCGASIGIGLTGVAGPGPQDGIDPGTVFVAAVSAHGTRARALTGRPAPADRWQVRAAAVRTALALLEDSVPAVPGPGTTQRPGSFGP